MSNYYAVCNVHGPISMKLDADNLDSAKAEFAALRSKTLRNAIDDAKTDAEDDLGIDGDGMSEEDFDRALSKAGAEPVCSLAEVVNAHAGTVAHEAGGWYLWRTDERDAAEELPADAVIVETMPDHLRGSHRAARNWGTYPANGAERRIMSRADAEALLGDEPEYDHIVRDATPADAERYEIE